MKKELNIPLQEIYDIIDAGRFFSSCHNSDPANPDGLDPWALIESIEIIGMPILRSETAMIHYPDLKGVILEIQENGNYWVGLTPSIPCAEFTEETLRPTK